MARRFHDGTAAGRVGRLGLRATLVLALGLNLIAPVEADCGSAASDAPRTLILALDGVSYRIVEQARAEGAFANWPEPRPVVSTFPSMTNVAFTALFRPVGLDPVGGYEIRHYDWERNDVVGGPSGYKRQLSGWKDYFQITSRSNKDKVGLYLSPKKKAWKTVLKAGELLQETDQDVIVTHVGATDVLAHFHGDASVLKFLHRLSPELERMRRDHEESHGRPLRIVLVSDHGNTPTKVKTEKGVPGCLKEAGFRLTDTIEGPDDLVAPRYGVVNYGVMFMQPERVVDAAQAVAALPTVEFAAWIAGEGEIRVVSAEGAATVRWRTNSPRRFAYEIGEADPLRLASVLDRLEADDRLDADGFASEYDWLVATVDGDYPDAARRLIESLNGQLVRNAATVVFSIKPGYAQGSRSARFGASVRGGKLEGTHGGLDRQSSLGFLIATDDGTGAAGPLRLGEVLAAWPELEPCLPPAPTESAP